MQSGRYVLREGRLWGLPESTTPPMAAASFQSPSRRSMGAVPTLGPSLMARHRCASAAAEGGSIARLWLGRFHPGRCAESEAIPPEGVGRTSQPACGRRQWRV